MHTQHPDGGERLRSQAEAQLPGRPTPPQLTPDEAAHLIQELQVHQIELRLQNESLRSTQAELVTARDRLAMLFNKTPIGYVILDENGLIQESNETFCQMTHCTATHLRDKAFATFLVEADRPTFLGRYRAFFQSPGQKRLEAVLIGGGRGETRSVSIEGTTIPSPEPSRSGHSLLVSLTDITSIRRLESQLLQSQKMEAVGQLAGGVAHDFNNILAAIILQLGMLRMNPDLNHETRRELEELVAEANRAAHLTRQLLMFSRRSVIQAKLINLSEVSMNLAQMLRRLLGESIRLELRLESPLPAVEADPGLMEQVIMNLCLNARDAMGAAGTLTVATELAQVPDAPTPDHPDRRPGEFVCLTVSDTGCGMDEATLKHAFEPFFTTKEIGKGTGLGLATVSGIVSQHKGWIEVTSSPGKGSSFRVFLPAIPRPMAAPAVPRAEIAETATRGYETILLVEDEPVVRQTFAKCLRSLGYRVLEAQTGLEALDVWAQNGKSIDLVLTDMAMPGGMTGLELVERLREHRTGLRAIISSGYSIEFQRHDLTVRSDILYLPKPFDPTALAAAVRKCLDLRA